MLESYYRQKIKEERYKNLLGNEVVIIEFKSANSTGTMIMTLKHYQKKSKKIAKIFKNDIYSLSIKRFNEDDLKKWESVL